jgi:hypothetical protein
VAAGGLRLYRVICERLIQWAGSDGVIPTS